jgi:hypothetical protein
MAMSNVSSAKRIPAAAMALGLGGLVPFAAGAAALWLPLPWLTPDAGLRLIVVYGAIILSFLGGIRWGVALGPYDTARQSRDFAASVLGALAGLAAVFLPPVPALALLIAGFLSQALWDVTSAEAGRLPGWFGRLRMLLTSGAVIAQIAALVAIILG